MTWLQVDGSMRLVPRSSQYVVSMEVTKTRIKLPRARITIPGALNDELVAPMPCTYHSQTRLTSSVFLMPAAVFKITSLLPHCSPLAVA
jgi:hypothetical protein